MKLNERQLFGKELSETDWVLLGRIEARDKFSETGYQWFRKQANLHTQKLSWLRCCMSFQFIHLKLLFALGEEVSAFKAAFHISSVQQFFLRSKYSTTHFSAILSTGFG